MRISLFGDEVERIASVDPLTGEIVEELDAAGAVPRVALRHLRRAHAARHRGHRGRARRAAGVVRGARQAARGAAAADAHHLRPRDAARDRRVLRDRELLAPPRRPRTRARRRTRCSTTSPTTSSSCSTSRTQTVPQLHGQYEGDRSRKDTLVEHGFRLPSAMDNRPLRFEEFIEKVNQVVFLSAHAEPVRARAVDARSSSRSCGRPGSSIPR